MRYQTLSMGARRASRRSDHAALCCILTIQCAHKSSAAHVRHAGLPISCVLWCMHEEVQAYPGAFVFRRLAECSMLKHSLRMHLNAFCRSWICLRTPVKGCCHISIQTNLPPSLEVQEPWPVSVVNQFCCKCYNECQCVAGKKAPQVSIDRSMEEKQRQKQTARFFSKRIYSSTCIWTTLQPCLKTKKASTHPLPCWCLMHVCP